MKIYPSLIASNLLELGRTIKTLETDVDGFHIDIMDFHFVMNLTMGPIFVEAIKNTTQKSLWIHLMVDHPLPYIKLLKLSSHDIIIVHREQKNFKEALLEIKKNDIKACLAYNPDTPFESDRELFSLIDTILLMSVHPGFSGQDFIPASFIKLMKLKNFLSEHNLMIPVGFDGGVNQHNIQEAAEHECDHVAIGSAIFQEKNYLNALLALKKLVE